MQDKVQPGGQTGPGLVLGQAGPGLGTRTVIGIIGPSKLECFALGQREPRPSPADWSLILGT